MRQHPILVSKRLHPARFTRRILAIGTLGIISLCLLTSCVSQHQRNLDARQKLIDKWKATGDESYLNVLKATAGTVNPRLNSREPETSWPNADDFYWQEQQRQKAEERRHQELMNQIQDTNRQRDLGY